MTPIPEATSTKLRSLDTLTNSLFLIYLLSTLALLLLAGCADLRDQLNTSTASGGTILTDGITAVPEVVTNPLNFVAWGKIAGVAAVGLASLFGVRLYKAKISKP